MESHGERLAVETTGGALERSAGRAAGPEVHQPGDCAGENLAVSSPARANHTPESGRTKESLSGRFESSPGVCALGPPGVDWSPILRQRVKTHFSSNGELSHGIVSQAVHEGV